MPQKVFAPPTKPNSTHTFWAHLFQINNQTKDLNTSRETLSITHLKACNFTTVQQTTYMSALGYHRIHLILVNSVLQHQASSTLAPKQSCFLKCQATDAFLPED